MNHRFPFQIRTFNATNVMKKSQHIQKEEKNNFLFDTWSCINSSACPIDLELVKHYLAMKTKNITILAKAGIGLRLEFVLLLHRYLRSRSGGSFYGFVSYRVGRSFARAVTRGQVGFHACLLSELVFENKSKMLKLSFFMRRC